MWSHTVDGAAFEQMSKCFYRNEAESVKSLFFHNKTSFIHFVLSFNGNQRSIKVSCLLCVVPGFYNATDIYAKLEDEMTT